MARIEQAVFTSAETDRSAGYQVVAHSPGAVESDLRELAVWGPSHDSLLDFGPNSASLNFHPLPSGAYCVSRTTAAGWEYSGRGGHRVYTQCLIVPPDVLRRFANNPFSLIRAATAGGVIEVYDRVPSRLEPLQLAGRASAVDQDLLARLAAKVGPHKLAKLVQAALDSTCLALACGEAAEDLIAGLLACLPVECRLEMPFSTALKFSSRRPFRVVALSDDRAEHRWVAHRGNVAVLDLAADASNGDGLLDGWARLIERVLTAGRAGFLSTQLSRRRPQLTSEDLPALALQLWEDFDASALRSDHDVKREFTVFPSSESDDDLPRGDHPGGEVADLSRAHAPHRRFEKTAATEGAVGIREIAPSKILEACSPEVTEKLEELDDVVYDALSGKETALEQVQTLWPEVLGELGDELVAESREQYLCYALSIWQQQSDPPGTRDPVRAVQALEVLCVLFEAD